VLPSQTIVFRLVRAVMMISTLVTSYGIVPHGILELSTAPALRRCVTNLMENGCNRRVRNFDEGEVDYIRLQKESLQFLGFPVETKVAIVLGL